MPLKLGHDGPDARDDPAHQFALGWVTRVYREGRKLLADFEVPPKVADWIKEGFLRFVSVELLKDVKASTREIPWVLDAVALLGADQPAVGILKSLSLTMARSAALPHRARVAFTRENSTGGHKPTMADENKDQNVAALMARLDKLEAEKKALELKAAERESFERKLQELETQTRNEKIAAHRKQVLEMFETAIKDKKILPAARERFKRVYKVDTDAVLDIPLTDVETFIRENPNPDAPKNPASLAANGEPPVDASADVKALSIARKFVRENANDPLNREKPIWLQLQEAGMAAFRANPELGQAWQDAPGFIGGR